MGRHSAPEPGALDTGEQPTARSWLARPKRGLTGNGHREDAPTTVLPALTMRADSEDATVLTPGHPPSMAEAQTTVFPVIPASFPSDPTNAPSVSPSDQTRPPVGSPLAPEADTHTYAEPDADPNANADQPIEAAAEAAGALADRRHSIGRWVAVVLFWLIAMVTGLLSAVVSVARYGCSSGKGGLACGNNGTAIGVVLAVATIATVGVVTVLAFDADRHARFWLRPLGVGLVLLIIIGIVARIVLGTAG